MKIKRVTGFPGYAVSQDGRFWSCRQSIYRNQLPLVWKEKQPAIDYQGYAIAVFQIDGKTTTKRLHRVVWEAFRGPIPPGLTVNHENGNKLCNTLDNLSLMTQADNMRHAWKTGLFKNIKKGEAAGNVRFTTVEVKYIRQLYDTGKHSMTELARQFKTCSSTICDIVNRTTWKHI